MPKRVLSGVALRDTLDKTVTISVQSQKKHKRLKKIVKSRKKYLSHDESGVIKAGDFVKIQEHSPISKRKKWIVIN